MSQTMKFRKMPACSNISGTELRQRLNEGREIPAWFTYPEVVHELRRSYPPRHKQGLTIFFTGLSGSGKSTIANVLLTKFLEVGGRPVTILDGDLVRKHLSSELGFSKEHRTLTFAASVMLRQRSPKMEASPSVPPSPLTTLRAGTCAS